MIEQGQRDILRPATLTLDAAQTDQGNPEIPPLPSTTIAMARADFAAQEANRIAQETNELEKMKLRKANAQDMRREITDLEKFNGDIGELNHFLKGGDGIMNTIQSQAGADLLEEADAKRLRVALARRVRRSVLNLIQADEDTPWNVIKERLKKAYGGGRWTPEEDMLQMFRETKRPNQSNGHYAAGLLAKLNNINDKLREIMETSAVETWMIFMTTVLKVQLAKDTGKKDGLPRDKSFAECAQEMVDASARDEEAREGFEPGWSRVTYKRVEPGRSRGRQEYGKRLEAEFGRRERTATEKKPFVDRRGGRREERKCFECGKTGHLQAQCPRARCFECNTEGHKARQCPYIRRRNHDRGEPMEVNAQRMWRRSRRPSESGRSSETSGSEADSSEPGGRGTPGGAVRRQTAGRRLDQVKDE